MFKDLEKKLKKEYPTGFIFRQDIQEATRGIIKTNTVANYDTQGKGIKRFKVGNKVVYKIKDIIDYLEGIKHD